MLIGQQVLALRKQKRMSQTELARLSGLANGTVCDIEKGRLTPSLKTLEKLAKALGVHITVFFSDATGTEGY